MPVVPLMTGASRFAMGGAHHGAAEDDLARVVGEAAAGVEQVAELRADGDDQVARLASRRGR